MNKKAYTLVETVITVVTIGALAAVAIPQYNLAVERAKAREGAYIARVIGTAFHAYVAEYEQMPTSWNSLGVQISTSKYFSSPSPSSCLTNTKNPATAANYKNCTYLFYMGSLKFNYVLKYKPSGKVGCWDSGRDEGICRKLGFADYGDEVIDVY